MGVLSVDQVDEEHRAAYARDWLADDAPGLSARTLLSRGQRNVAIALLFLVIVGVALSARDLGLAIVTVATLSYATIVVNRISMTVRALRHPSLVTVSDEEARAAPDDGLPFYTVLVPVFDEADVIPLLVSNLRALEYPRHRLDLKFLVEQSDGATIAALVAAVRDEFEVVVVPDGSPRTKPRALNYGLTFARGELVTIYDAEDRPDPLQLRKAAVAFGRLPADVGCLQARLDYWNGEQNLITRWFETEYLQWFRLFLPGLSGRDAPVPLGGTSNYVRRSVLQDIGAWDPYNVTEDADLGIRLHRAGYRCAVLDSETWEEANSDYVNWNNQRSRWYKGYLQTWLVHMRHPLVLLDELGWRGWLQFNAFVGGTPVLALMNLVFWSLTLLWFVAHPGFIKALFPPLLYYPALFCFVLGNVTMAYLYVISAYLSKQVSLVWAACLVPVYWLMMSIAAVKAFWQLFVSRSLWEKTLHGLAVDEPSGPSANRFPEPLSGQAAPVPEFVPSGPPAMAAAIDNGRTPQAQVNRPGWEADLGHLLRIVGLALASALLYVFVMAGILSSPPSASAVGAPQTRAPAEGSVVARMVIPSVGIDTPVVEGTAASSLRAAAGHLRGTALPGDRGIAVVVGHRRFAARTLGALDQVQVGDAVFVYTGGGVARYLVTSASTAEQFQLMSASSEGSQLIVVTSSGGLNGGGLTVVRATLASQRSVRFTGRRPPLVGVVRIPGADAGSALVASLWLVAFVAAFALWRRVRRAWGTGWAIALAGPIVLLGLVEICVSAANALPVTF